MRNWMDRVARLPGGLKFLITMREDLLDGLNSASKSLDKTSQLKMALEAVDVDLKFRLQSWVAGGYLELDRVTWASSAALLEKVRHYIRYFHITR